MREREKRDLERTYTQYVGIGFSKKVACKFQMFMDTQNCPASISVDVIKCFEKRNF